MVHIDVEYAGELHCTLKHGPSGTVIETDAPLDNMGRGLCFSPTDLCAASLVSCIVTTMGIIARKHNFELRDCKASVEKIMTSEPTRRIAELPVRIAIDNQYSQKELALLHRAAETCPVKESLSPSIKITLQWEQL